MLFEWDERKRKTNLAKHGIVVEAADQRSNYGEERIRAYGKVCGRVLCVIYTWRNGVRRIISARKARRDEEKAYNARNPERGARHEK